ncbi:hypothetical protein ACFWZ2_39945 [Streptomyces sp. NPDC059002]|uniref:hypothetical protein n=1 Tax=Streptomyces sp. NPDC059002 TaxID=3346690 RepID=UPI003682EC80
MAAWPVLKEHLRDGLIVLLGPASEPVATLMSGRLDLAEELLAPWRRMAGAGLRLEAVFLGRAGTGAGSLRLAARTVQLGDRLHVPVVVSNAARYADPEQHRSRMCWTQPGCCARSTGASWMATSGGSRG